MAEFKDMLKYYREREHLSQAALAEKIHVSPATIGMYESGKRMPKKEIEEALADFFNVSLDNLRGIDTESRKFHALDLFAGVGAIPYSDAIEKCMRNKRLYQYLVNYAQYLIENEDKIK